jgi:hypothetical protein
MAHCGLCQGCHEIKKDFIEHHVEALSSGLPVLSFVDQGVVCGMVHCAASEEWYADYEVKVSLEEVNDP